MHFCVCMWRPEEDIGHPALSVSLEKVSLAEPGVRLVASKLHLWSYLPSLVLGLQEHTTLFCALHGY